jgi:hypothetical protein
MLIEEEGGQRKTVLSFCLDLTNVRMCRTCRLVPFAPPLFSPQCTQFYRNYFPYFLAFQSAVPLYIYLISHLSTSDLPVVLSSLHSVWDALFNLAPFLLYVVLSVWPLCLHTFDGPRIVLEVWLRIFLLSHTSLSPGQPFCGASIRYRE